MNFKEISVEQSRPNETPVEKEKLSELIGMETFGKDREILK